MHCIPKDVQSLHTNHGDELCTTCADKETAIDAMVKALTRHTVTMFGRYCDEDALYSMTWLSEASSLVTEVRGDMPGMISPWD